jgi:hypothetical protein
MKLPLAVVAGAIALLQTQAPDTGPAATVRLHHLHFRADDPAEAMAAAIRAHGGTRAIVQGLGVGVKVEDTYLLFDRPDPQVLVPSPTTLRAAGVPDRFIAAARWLGLRQVEATVTEAGSKLLIATPADASLDHLAFATAEIASIEALLRKRGIEPLRRSTESVFYRAGDELIEVTAETERPDAFWCPMHPDVRGPAPRKCPICSMDLVAIAPPRVGEYRVDVTQIPAGRGGGIEGLKLRVRDPDSGGDVAMFAEAHERILHLFIISRDLAYFAHEHPEWTADGFELKMKLPAGAYMLIADFLPGGGYPQMVHRAIVTPGFRASPFAPPAHPPEDLSDKVLDGMRIRLRADQVKGKPEAVLRFRFTDAAADTPLRDLQLYLGSSGHLLVVSPDLTHSVHAHPEGRTSGPDINFGVVFPAAGVYKVWIQVQRGNKVTSAPFVVTIDG